MDIALDAIDGLVITFLEYALIDVRYVRIWEYSVVAGQMAILILCIRIDAREVDALSLLEMSEDIVVASSFLIALRCNLHDHLGHSDVVVVI
jgi:hypothetical protein